MAIRIAIDGTIDLDNDAMMYQGSGFEITGLKSVAMTQGTKTDLLNNRSLPFRVELERGFSLNECDSALDELCFGSDKMGTPEYFSGCIYLLPSPNRIAAEFAFTSGFIQSISTTDEGHPRQKVVMIIDGITLLQINTQTTAAPTPGFKRAS